MCHYLRILHQYQMILLGGRQEGVNHLPTDIIALVPTGSNSQPLSCIEGSATTRYINSLCYYYCHCNAGPVPYRRATTDSLLLTLLLLDLLCQWVQQHDRFAGKPSMLPSSSAVLSSVYCVYVLVSVYKWYYVPWCEACCVHMLLTGHCSVHVSLTGHCCVHMSY